MHCLLSQRVIPMLPEALCEELCSLNPGTDRLAFSVMWQLTEDGEIEDQWIGKTIIRSCSKLAYSHAQRVIDGVEVTKAPVKVHGGHEWNQVIF